MALVVLCMITVTDHQRITSTSITRGELPKTFTTVSLHKVVEVREGQATAMFDKFPYEQVENQSFSLVYLQEGDSYLAKTFLSILDMVF